MNDDRTVLRTELCQTLNVSSETMRRWLRDGKIPKPDYCITARSIGWKRSTLDAAGIAVPAKRDSDHDATKASTQSA